jgi:hypothetical protein
MKNRSKHAFIHHRTILETLNFDIEKEKIELKNLDVELMAMEQKLMGHGIKVNKKINGRWIIK